MTKLIFGLAWLLSCISAAQAATFEGAGAVQQVIVERSLIEVNDKLYSLPNGVTEGQNTNGGPVIFQLRQGTIIGFSGTDADLQYPSINSLVIFRQPTPDEEAEFLRETPND